MLISKIKFISGFGQKIQGNFLDALQNSVRFDGEPRNDLAAFPSRVDEEKWAVNQRDPLIDWEVNEDTDVLGNLSWGGRILASDGETYAPAATFTNGSNFKFWVHGGVALDKNKELIEWGTQSVTALPGTVQYTWVEIIRDTNTDIIQGVAIRNTTSLPPNVDAIPLAKLNITNGGVIEEYIDIRPNRFVVDLSNRTDVLRFKDSEVSDTGAYIAKDWERILVDTSTGSIYIDLPESPANNSEVSIVDSEGYFHLYPVFVRPFPGGEINTSNRSINGVPDDAFALTRRYGVYTLVYSESKNNWYFIDNQEQTDFKKGSWLSCGGKQKLPSGTQCIAGQTPLEFINENNPPVYEIIDGECWLAYNDNAGFYSNPTLLETNGLKVVFDDARCTDENHTQVSGGTYGFTDAEFQIRLNISTEILEKWNPDTLNSIDSAPGTFFNSERDTLFDLNNRVAYALLSNYWVQVNELEPILPVIVSTGNITAWYNAVRSYVEATAPLLLGEFDAELAWITSL